MSTKQILAHIDRISDAPEAVTRIRRFILELAVRGKLVHQQASDESASKLLGDRTLSLSPSDEPWQLPLGWAWSSLGLIGESIGGGTPSKSNADFWRGTIPWVSPKDMKVDRVADAGDHISEDAVANSSVRLIPAGSLLLVVRGMILAHSFPTALSSVPVTINQDMKAIVPFRNDISRMLLLITKGMKSEVLRLVQRATHGTCKLLTNDLFGLPIPIPPLAEQHRIVAKVDELMALCDRFEAAQAERERRRDRVMIASLQRLSQRSDDAQAFCRDARFHLEHFSRLTMRPEHVRQLRQTILHLAVSGQLNSQDPNDEPAVELLKRIQEQKARPTKAASIASQNLEMELEPDVIPFPLPERWAWARLGDVIHLVSGQHLKPGEYSDQDYSGLPYITGPADFGQRGLVIKRFAVVKKAVAKQEQILLTVKGAGVGKTAVCDLSEVAISRQLMAMTALGWNQQFLLLTTHRLAATLKERARSLIPGISRHDVDEFVFPLPPLAEQHRIVAKVDELMAVCDRLEAQLSTAQTQRSRLLEALLHEALENRVAADARAMVSD